MSNTSRSVSFHLERHARLIAWWDSQENASDVIRSLIEDHLEATETANGKPSGVDLAAIRQVVEAALDQKLAGLELKSGPAPDQSETDDALSAFDNLLE